MHSFCREFFFSLFSCDSIKNTRWGFAADQACDMLVAEQAVAHHALPFIGRLSASGPYVFALFYDLPLIINATNSEAIVAYEMESKLFELYPDTAFAVYNYTSSDSDRALALSLVLATDGKAHDNGMRAGVTHAGNPINHQVAFNGDSDTGLHIYNLEGTPNAKLEKDDFTLFKPRAVYNSVEKWHK